MHAGPCDPHNGAGDVSVLGLTRSVPTGTKLASLGSMPSKHTSHETRSVQPGHARPPRSEAPAQHDRTATGQRGDRPENKPDEVVAEHSRRAQEHIDEHQAELAAEGDSDAAPAEDAQHGYSQDAGYAQSAGNPEAGQTPEPKRQQDGKNRTRH